MWVALPTLVVAVMSGQAGRLTQPEARQKNFTRWFAHQHPVSATLRSPHEVNITVFTDYECPFCRSVTTKLAALVTRLHKEYQRPIGLHLRDYPMDSSCNPAFKIANFLRPAACRAAAAVRYVASTRGAEAADKLARSLSQEAPTATNADIDNLVADQGFVAASGSVRSDVVADVNFGISIGVAGAPTLFIDGVHIQTADMTLIEAAVRFDLRR